MQHFRPCHERIDFIERDRAQRHLFELDARCESPAIGSIHWHRIAQILKPDSGEARILVTQHDSRCARVDDHLHTPAVHLRPGHEMSVSRFPDPDFRAAAAVSPGHRLDRTRLERYGFRYLAIVG